MKRKATLREWAHYLTRVYRRSYRRLRYAGASRRDAAGLSWRLVKLLAAAAWGERRNG